MQDRTGRGAVTPSPMPGGNFVYCQCADASERHLHRRAQAPARARKILPDESIVQYAPSPDPDLGYVLFLRGGNGPGSSGTLMAQAIHPRQLRLLGDPDRDRGEGARLLGVGHRRARLQHGQHARPSEHTRDPAGTAHLVRSRRPRLEHGRRARNLSDPSAVAGRAIRRAGARATPPRRTSTSTCSSSRAA